MAEPVAASGSLQLQQQLSSGGRGGRQEAYVMRAGVLVAGMGRHALGRSRA